MPDRRRSWRFSAIAVAVSLAVGWGVWLSGPRPRQTLAGDGTTLWPTRFSPDGRWLAVERRTPKLDLLEHQVWDLQPPRVVLRFPGARVYARTFSNDGRWFAQAYIEDDNDIKTTRVSMWDLESGDERADVRWTDLPGSMPWNMSRSVLAFTAENRLLLGSTNYGLWDVQTRTKIDPLELLVASGPMPNNWESSLLGYVQDRRVRLYSTAHRKVVSEFVLPADIRNYRWSEDGQTLGADFYLYVGGQALLGIHVFNFRTGTSHRVAGATEQSIQSISSDGQWLATSAESNLTQWWRRLLRLDRQGLPVIRVFHVPSGSLRHEFSGQAALFAPDGSLLAVRTSAGDVAIWDMPPAQPVTRSVVWGLVAGATLIVLRGLVRARMWRGRS